MHVLKMLQKNAADALPEIHKVRLEGVFAAVQGLLTGRQLWLTALGRNLPGPVGEKHKIKRVDRLLDNPHLQRERLAVYQWLARFIIGSCQRPLIVVDYADLDDRNASRWTSTRLSEKLGAWPMLANSAELTTFTVPRFSCRQ